MPRLTHRIRQRCSRAGLIAALCVLGAGGASAQTVEVSPFGGFRLGDDPDFATPAGDASGLGTGPSFGGVADWYFEPGRSVTFLFSHGEDLVHGVTPDGAPATVRVSFDHWLAGATDEYGQGRMRPFLTGLLGVSYLHGGGVGEARFTLGGGGGAKLLATRHFGVRFDGRVYATFVGGEGDGGFCTPGICLFGLDVSVFWQVEGTVGAVLSF